MNKLLAAVAALTVGFVLSGSAWACHTLSDGEVTKVDTDSKQVVVSAGEKSLTFTTAEKTKVSINGKSAALSDLKPGDKVVVDYEAKNDVLAIRATREG